MAFYTLETAIRKMHTLQRPDESNNVAIRLIFLRVGELNTQEEKFQAHIVIQARWFLNSKENENNLISSLSTDDQTELDDGKIVKLSNDYSQNNWHPKLFILNMSHDHEEEIKYSIKKFASRIQIREVHDIYAEFYSKFNLHHFPNDIQELKVSIGSGLYDTEVILEADSNRLSGINHEAFIDQQEWKLYDHVNTEAKFIKGFLFQSDDDDEVEAPGHERKRSILTVSCHAARRSSYFYWNGFCLIFLITLISFSTFAIPPNTIQNRINILCTLLLTSIAFRWTISKSLPNIPYLTTIDRYAILSMIVLLILCAWHAIIGTIVYIQDHYDALNPDSRWTWLDRIVFIVLISLYMIIHLAMGIWHWRVPLAKRRSMKILDARYKQIVEKNQSRCQSLSSLSMNDNQTV